MIPGFFFQTLKPQENEETTFDKQQLQTWKGNWTFWDN